MPPNHEALPPALADLSAGDTAFFLDVDGTLLEFKDRPDAVVADPALIALLKALRAAADGAVALVSGRMVSDLDRIMSPLVLPAAGLHGADIRFADSHRDIIDAAILDPVRAPLHAFVAARPGLLLEDKGATLAIHYRHAPEREAEVRAMMQTAREGRALAVQEGKLVAELKPIGCDKGAAILTLMGTAPFAGRRPLFIGDDLTDEHGFRAVNAVAGVSIKVGSPDTPTMATFRLAEPRNVRALLGLICRLDDSAQKNGTSL